jgi:hypothetical protein
MIENISVENSDAIYEANGGPKTSQHEKATTKSFNKTRKSFCFL